MTKKVLSSMLAIALFSNTLITPVYADHISTEIVNLSEQSQVAAKLADIWPGIAMEHAAYGLSSEDVAHPILGSKIPTYRLSENGVVEVDYSLYPVLNADDEIVALCMAFYDNNNELALQFEKGFSSELNSAVSNLNSCEIALYYGNESLFVYQAGNRMRYLDDLHWQLHTEYAEPSNIEYYLHPESILDTATVLDTTAALDMRSVSLETNDSDSNIESNYLNISIVDQGVGTSLCWAACTSSIGRHETGIQANPSALASIVGLSSYQPGDISHVEEALADMYGITDTTARYSAILQYNTVVSEIDEDEADDNNGDPVYVALHCYNLNSGHAVAIDGYFNNTTAPSKLYRIMDPLEDDYVAISVNDNVGISYVIDTNVYNQVDYLLV